MEMMAQLQEAAAFIENRLSIAPRIGIILGSGLGALGERIVEPVVIPYEDIPHFYPATVEGHSGRMLIGRLRDKPVVVLQGRLHFYEGLSMGEVVFPVRCMKLLGIDNLVVTNAAGSLNRDYEAGKLMLIRDHLKMVTDSPLRGPNIDEFGPRFNDMSDPYPAAIRELAKRCAADLQIDLKEGVYCYMPGPSYETAAEVRMLGLLGGHAVGMSTVPEVITAVHCGMRVLGISCLSNMGTGILDQPLHHDDIIRAGEQVRTTFIALLEAIIASWPLG